MFVNCSISAPKWCARISWPTRHWGHFTTGFAAPDVFRENSVPRSLAFSKVTETRKAWRAINWLHLSDMKNLFSSVWRSLICATYRKHDPFLAYSIASFNSGGGWKEFLLKASLQNP